jgi:hypothetical protein
MFNDSAVGRRGCANKKQRSLPITRGKTVEKNLVFSELAGLVVCSGETNSVQLS